MRIRSYVDNLLAHLRLRERAPLPFLPPEIKARVLDMFEGAPADYLKLAHVDRGWRRAALDTVTLGQYLARRGAAASTGQPRAQRDTLSRLVRASRNLRVGRFRLRDIDASEANAARAQALQTPLPAPPDVPPDARLYYAPNGRWVACVQGGYDASLRIWDLSCPAAPRLTPPTICMFEPTGVAIANDGSTAWLHGPQTDIVFRSRDAAAGAPYVRTVAFDAFESTMRSFDTGFGADACALSPCGRWCVTETGSAHMLNLWRTDDDKPTALILHEPFIRNFLSTLFFSADATRVYAVSPSGEAICLDFGA